MISVGNDIEKVERFLHLLRSRPDLLKKIFTEYEWDYSSKKNQARTLAGIWCAKEAVVKALSYKIVVDIRDVEIKHHKNGVPFVYSINGVTYLNKLRIQVSISHCKNYATAVCIIWEFPFK